MTEDQYELMSIICRYSKNRKEAKDVMLKSFKVTPAKFNQQKSIAENVIDNYIKRNWGVRMKNNTYSLRKKSLKEIGMLIQLLDYKKGKVFEKVLIPLKKRIEGNGLPREFYDMIIKDSTKKKESMRGGYVELNAISKDGIILYCTEEHYCFMIHDIDCSKNFIFI